MEDFRAHLLGRGTHEAVVRQTVDDASEFAARHGEAAKLAHVEPYMEEAFAAGRTPGELKRLRTACEEYCRFMALQRGGASQAPVGAAPANVARASASAPGSGSAPPLPGSAPPLPGGPGPALQHEPLLQQFLAQPLLVAIVLGIPTVLLLFVAFTFIRENGLFDNRPGTNAVIHVYNGDPLAVRVVVVPKVGALGRRRRSFTLPPESGRRVPIDRQDTYAVGVPGREGALVAVGGPNDFLVDLSGHTRLYVVPLNYSVQTATSLKPGFKRPPGTMPLPFPKPGEPFRMVYELPEIAFTFGERVPPSIQLSRYNDRKVLRKLADERELTEMRKLHMTPPP